MSQLQSNPIGPDLRLAQISFSFSGGFRPSSRAVLAPTSGRGTAASLFDCHTANGNPPSAFAIKSAWTLTGERAPAPGGEQRRRVPPGPATDGALGREASTTLARDDPRCGAPQLDVPSHGAFARLRDEGGESRAHPPEAERGCLTENDRSSPETAAHKTEAR